MRIPLRALHLEDNPTDSDLIESLLVKEGIPCRIQRVATRLGFVQALEQERVDLILSDVSLPAFNGMEALAIVRDKMSTNSVYLRDGEEMSGKNARSRR